jgi:uncharacterized protein
MKTNCSPLGIFACCTLLAAVFAPIQSSMAGSACVWRVTNTPAPCYLVGTIHALSGTDYPLPAPYYQALKESRQFYFEVAPDPKSEADFGKKWDVATTYSQGDEIRRHIHSKTWTFLEKKFRNSNYLGHDFHFGEHYVKDMMNLRPWAIAFYIWGIRGYNDVYGQHGVDRFISYQAMRQGKACDGLESGAEHVEVLAGMADIDAELMLLDALVRGDQRRDDFNQMRDAWKHGDVEQLAALQKRERDLNPGGDMRLLDYRNLRWIRKIDGAFRSGTPTAIVAGAAHFCGPNNVRELLEKKGFKIEQL